MSSDQIRLTLMPSSDDPDVLGSAYQEELQAFGQQLGELSTIVSRRMYFQDGAEALVRQLGEYALTMAPGAFPAFTGLIGAWLQARFGRKVRLKVGDVEAEASTVADVEELLERAKAFRQDSGSEP